MTVTTANISDAIFNSLRHESRHKTEVKYVDDKTIIIKELRHTGPAVVENSVTLVMDLGDSSLVNISTVRGDITIVATINLSQIEDMDVVVDQILNGLTATLFAFQ